jgi:hypothetical protein
VAVIGEIVIWSKTPALTVHDADAVAVLLRLSVTVTDMLCIPAVFDVKEYV